jgi:hypothetical protein
MLDPETQRAAERALRRQNAFHVERQFVEAAKSNRERPLRDKPLIGHEAPIEHRLNGISTEFE